VFSDVVRGAVNTDKTPCYLHSVYVFGNNSDNEHSS
jgi:hypothetical protein